MRDLLRGALLVLALPACALAADAPIETAPLRIGAAAAPSLTAPSVEDAREAINRTPGGVAIVPAETIRTGRAATPKDILDYVPGVFVQTKFGEDSRLSIRGSGLSRNFHLRGIRLLQDDVPLNTADGGGDFQEVDPLLIRYAEVYKGANALLYGATTLGGAVNLVTPTGRDWPLVQARLEGGSFDYARAQVSSGGVSGPFDWFVSRASSTTAASVITRSRRMGGSRRMSGTASRPPPRRASSSPTTTSTRRCQAAFARPSRCRTQKSRP